jgi:hypothetical protein
MNRKILKVKIPYIEGVGSKFRPVLQLSSPSDEYNNFQVAYITSQKPDLHYPTDLLISKSYSKFDSTGLTDNSYIRCSKIFTIDSSMVDLIIGDLPSDLNQKLDKILLTHFNLQF